MLPDRRLEKSLRPLPALADLFLSGVKLWHKNDEGERRQVEHRNLKEENLMKFYNSVIAIATLAVVAGSGMDRIVDGADAPPPSMGFFVTSAKSKTGNLGGLGWRGSDLPKFGDRRGARR